MLPPQCSMLLAVARAVRHRAMQPWPNWGSVRRRRGREMKMSKMFLAAVTVMLLSGPLSAHANIIYDWTGDCQRITQGSAPLCTHATLHIVTTDAYVPGEVFSWTSLEFQHPTFLEARYSDDNIAHDLAPFDWRVVGPAFSCLPRRPTEGPCCLCLISFNRVPQAPGGSGVRSLVRTATG
jgi:hypothetical protein